MALTTEVQKQIVGKFAQSQIQQHLNWLNTREKEPGFSQAYQDSVNRIVLKGWYLDAAHTKPAAGPYIQYFTSQLASQCCKKTRILFSASMQVSLYRIWQTAVKSFPRYS